MKLALTLIGRELRTRPRQSRFFLGRCLLVALGAVILGFGYWAAMEDGSTTMGLIIFKFLSFATLAIMLFVAAKNASWLILREKEDRTLGLLFLSDITGIAFLVSKLFTSLVTLLMSLVSVLPLFLLCISLGGVSAMQIINAFALVLSEVVFLACLGLMVASIANSERSGGVWMFLIMLTSYVLIPMGALLCFAMLELEPTEDVFCFLSPFIGMNALLWGRQYVPILWHCGFVLAITLPMLALSAFVLPRRIFGKDREPMGQRIRRAVGLRKGRSAGTARGNPMTWKDFHFIHGGLASTWIKFFIATATIYIIVWMLGFYTRWNEREVFQTYGFLTMVYTGLVVLIGGMSHCGLSFHREKRSRSLEVLLTTSLTEHEIINGKIKAVWLSMLPWFLLGLLATVFIGVLNGNQQYFWEPFMFIIFEYLVHLFGYSFLCMYLSLRMKRNLALGISLGILILYNTMGRIFISVGLGAGGGGMEGMIAIDIMLHVGMGIAFLAMTYEELRRQAYRTDA